MGFVLATVFAALDVLGGLAASPTLEAKLGVAFRLRVGESALVEAEALQIGFLGVPADSRCPKGEQCVREGDATVRVWLQQGDRPRVTLELHTSSKEGGAAGALGFEVRLRRLDPYPVTGRTLDPEQYVATLELTRGSGASSESP